MGQNEHLKITYVISTKNISKETAKMLDHPEFYPALGSLSIFEKIGYGWWIYVSPFARCQSLGHLPKDLTDVMKRASDLHAEWILLDRDACPDPDLPVYEQ